MSNNNVSYLTEEGLQKLKDELNYLENVERPSISQKIAEAREKGDISENAEYDAAKEEQSMLEMKIAKLKETLANARLVDQSKINTSTVQLLNKVKLKNLSSNKIVTYTIVAESEADLKDSKISINTPIAKALIGRKVGDTVDVQVPSGNVKFEILDISL